jgi:hypothetical protein
VEESVHQRKTLRRIVAHGRDLRLSRGQGSACMLAHRRVVIAKRRDNRADPALRERRSTRHYKRCSYYAVKTNLGV